MTQASNPVDSVLDAKSPVQARGVVCRYGSRVAVSSVDIAFKPGITALLGRNGAGKSTLMRTLATVALPDEGQVLSAGKSLRERTVRRQYRRSMGWLPQQLNVPMASSLRAYLEYAGWLKSLGRRTRQQAAPVAAEAVGLADRLDEPMLALSGGMLKRAGLAMAIVAQPKVLLLDEPTAGLDPGQRAEFAHYLRGIAACGTVVLATHLMEDVAMSADHVAVLAHGRLTFDGTLVDFGGVERHSLTIDDLSSAFLRATASTPTAP